MKAGRKAINRRGQAAHVARCREAGVCKTCGEAAKPGRLRCDTCTRDERNRRREARTA